MLRYPPLECLLLVIKIIIIIIIIIVINVLHFV